MSKSKLPLRRIFNMSGTMPSQGMSTPGHKRIQVGWPDANYSYAIVEFRLWPGDTKNVANLAGVLTLAKEDSLEPGQPSFKDSNQLAWSTYNQVVETSLPTLGVHQYENQLVDDENYFDRNIYLHTVDELGTQDINYWIKLAEFETKPDVGALVMVKQYGQLMAQGA